LTARSNESGTSISDNFRPPLWLQSRHLQTLGGRFFRRCAWTSYERKRIDLEDGDFIDLDFDQSEEFFRDASRGNVLIVHGLEGCSYSGYVLTTIRHLRNRGFGCVAMNLRSCSGEPNRTPQFYHSGQSIDLRRMIRNLSKTIEDKPFAVVGFSLGANILLKYLGEEGSNSPLSAAVAVSVPFDLSAGADFIGKGFSQVYEKYFLYQLKLKLRRKAERRSYDLDLSNLNEMNTIRAFDDAYTAPLHGFQSAEEYYQQSSCDEFLNSIVTPTLVIHSRDDPFVPARSIPEETLQENPSITSRLSERGGHVGFIAGWKQTGAVFWAEETLSRFLLRTFQTS